MTWGKEDPFAVMGFKTASQKKNNKKNNVWQAQGDFFTQALHDYGSNNTPKSMLV